MKTVHLVISGKVQGVFFRAEAENMANQLEIQGWIKNREDKKVEALVTGEPANLDQFIAWCKVGPAKAQVENVVVTQKPAAAFNKFEVIR